MTSQELQQLNRSNELIKLIDVEGIKVSSAKCHEFINQYQAILNNRLEALNCSSTAELKKRAIKETEQFPNWVLTEKGAPSLSSDVVRMYDAPICNEYCELNKIKRNISTLQNIASKAFSGSGYAYPVHNIRTDLGRVYVGEFNYTNLPKEYRPIVVAHEGRKFWNLDANRVELYILAYMSGDNELLNALNSSDYHQTVADHLGISRAQAKVVSFCMVYGATPRFLATELSISEAEAEKILSDFGSKFSVAWSFIQNTFDKGTETGEAISGYGTVRSFPMGADCGKSCVSHTIQSTAGEAIRLILPDVVDFVSELGGRLVLTVFDSFLLELPQSVTQEEMNELSKKLEQASVKWRYPLYFSVEELGETWL